MNNVHEHCSQGKKNTKILKKKIFLGDLIYGISILQLLLMH